MVSLRLNGLGSKRRKECNSCKSSPQPVTKPFLDLVTGVHFQKELHFQEYHFKGALNKFLKSMKKPVFKYYLHINGYLHTNLFSAPLN